MQLNDTETEGDGEKSLRNWKLLMFYFRAQPRGMKYAFEAMHFITFVIGPLQWTHGTSYSSWSVCEPQRWAGQRFVWCQ